MSFFNLEQKDVVSVVFTVYPTRSIVLDKEGVGDGGAYGANCYKTSINIFDSGSMPGTGERVFFDLSGEALSQSFYLKTTPILKFNHVLTSSEKTVANKLALIYASSSFLKSQNYSSSSLRSTGSSSQILMIPNCLIGSEIKKGSFTLESPNGRKFYDDGYGGIYSGTILYGSIFYEYGIVLFGENTTYSTFGSTNSLTCSFSATNNIPTNIYICKAPKSMLNHSNNPSFSILSGTKNEITTKYPKVFLTSVGLYDENYELVGMAKLANPILLEESEGAEFRLKLNFI